MALQPCPACAHQVSPQAPTCPSCGHPIAGQGNAARDLAKVAGVAGAAWIIPNVVKWIAVAAIAIAMFWFLFGKQ